MKKKLLKTASVLLALTVFLLLFAGCQTTTVVGEWISDEGTSTLATTAAPTTAKTKTATKPTTRKTTKTTTKKTTTPTTTATTVNKQKMRGYERVKTAAENTSALEDLAVNFTLKAERKAFELKSSDVDFIGKDSMGNMSRSLQAQMRYIGTEKYEGFFYVHDHNQWYVAGDTYRIWASNPYRYIYPDKETSRMLNCLNLPSPESLEYITTKRNRDGSLVTHFSSDEKTVQTVYDHTISYLVEEGLLFLMKPQRDTVKEYTLKDVLLQYTTNEEGYIEKVSIGFDIHVVLVGETKNKDTGEWKQAYEAIFDSAVIIEWDVVDPGAYMTFAMPQGYEDFDVRE